MNQIPYLHIPNIHISFLFATDSLRKLHHRIGRMRSTIQCCRSSGYQPNVHSTVAHCLYACIANLFGIIYITGINPKSLRATAIACLPNNDKHHPPTNDHNQRHRTTRHQPQSRINGDAVKCLRTCHTRECNSLF